MVAANPQCAELIKSMIPEGYVTLEAYCREHRLDIVRMVALATWGHLKLKVVTVKPPRVKIGGSDLRVLLIKADVLPHPFTMSSRWTIDREPPKEREKKEEKSEPVVRKDKLPGFCMICERVGREEKWVRRHMVASGLLPGDGTRQKYTPEFVDRCVAVLSQIRDENVIKHRKPRNSSPPKDETANPAPSFSTICLRVGRCQSWVRKAMREAGLGVGRGNRCTSEYADHCVAVLSEMLARPKPVISEKRRAACAANLSKGRGNRVYSKAPAVIEHEGKEYLSVNEAARRVSLDRNTMIRRIRKGAIPGSIQIKPPGSKCRPSHYIPSDCPPVNSVI